MTSLRHAALVTSVVALGFASLVGCADADDPSVPPGAAAPSRTAIPPDATAPSPTAAEVPCDAVADAVSRHLRSDQVRAVTVEGQCTTVVVATTLADGDADPARRLCDRAGEVAYSGDVNSVRVLSGSGSELANGIAGMRCLT
ncbi:hypothetical protein OG767_25145 [Micromonospora sp. NBC_01392]|uniref:hypothetical protein n=1 Tax=Micromonospora sp. NBC_01392 TaxID=2903588 RepID=UPI003247E626